MKSITRRGNIIGIPFSGRRAWSTYHKRRGSSLQRRGYLDDDCDKNITTRRARQAERRMLHKILHP